VDALLPPPWSVDTGIDELVVVPSPNCPELLLPQHLTKPSAKTAQEWDDPVATNFAVEILLTDTGLEEVVVVPFPSAPLVPAPQHFTEPSANTAHELFEPTERETAFEIPET
jgi:hypothetical protein